MPTYEYVCKDCSETFDIFQSMSEQPIEKCPKCMGTMKRLFSTGAGFIFKGSGFYHTDYKKKERVPSDGNVAKSEAAMAAK